MGATLSTLLTAVVCFALGDGMWCILLPVDACLNVATVFLQYKFADAHYRSACGRLDSVAWNLLESRMQQAISKRKAKMSTDEMFPEEVSVPSVSNAEPAIVQSDGDVATQEV